MPVASLVSHTSVTSLWYPLAKRTTISLVSGSLHLLVYFCKKDEPEMDVKEKLAALAAPQPAAAVEAAGGVLTARSSDFVLVERASMPRVNSDDFVVVDEAHKKE